MQNTWLEQFAIGLQRAYAAGVRSRATSQLDITGVELERFFANFGAAAHDLMRGPAPDDVQRRIVDATPANAFLVTPLRLIFPEATFIHIVRNNREVVASLTNRDLKSVYKSQFIDSNEKQAHEHWQRAVGACLAAEHAYGSEVVRRLRRKDLIANPDSTLHAVLAFLGEPFDEACLRPFSAISAECAVSDRVDGQRTDPDLLSDVLTEEGRPHSPVNEDAINASRIAMWETWAKRECLVPHMPGDSTPPKRATPRATVPAILPPVPKPGRIDRLFGRKP